MAKRGKPVELEIESDAIRELMEFNNLGSLTELSKLTGIPIQTLHGWSQNERTPLNYINICLKLLKTGKSLEELQELFEQAQARAHQPSELKASSF